MRRSLLSPNSLEFGMGLSGALITYGFTRNELRLALEYSRSRTDSDDACSLPSVRF